MIIKNIPPTCKCHGKPNTNNYGEGTVWECDDCKAQYELKENQREGKFWMPLTKDRYLSTYTRFAIDDYSIGPPR